MKRWIIAMLLVALAGPVAAQNLAPAFSHGPTIPFVLVENDSTKDWKANMLAAGAGYSLNWNLLPNLDGSVRRLTIGVPQFVQLPDAGEFRYATGLTVGTFNNLVSVGAVVDLVDTATDRGAFLGKVTSENVRLVFAFGFNFGSGTQPSPQTVQSLQKAGVPVESKNPPCYIGW